MQKHELIFTVKKPFGNLHRARCVLIAAQDGEGTILLGAKPDFYPPTISRLLGGGVDQGETFEQAAIRELTEELGVSIRPDQLTPLVTFDVKATDETGRDYRHQTAVFAVCIGGQLHQPGDDVKSIITVTPDGLYELGERYEKLPEVLWYNGDEGLYAWADYAKLYGPVHKVAAEMIKASMV